MRRVSGIADYKPGDTVVYDRLDVLPATYTAAASPGPAFKPFGFSRWTIYPFISGGSTTTLIIRLLDYDRVTILDTAQITAALGSGVRITWRSASAAGGSFALVDVAPFWQLTLTRGAAGTNTVDEPTRLVGVLGD